MQKRVKKANFYSIGATIRTNQEIRCLPYEGFFLSFQKPLEACSTVKVFLFLLGWMMVNRKSVSPVKCSGKSTTVSKLLFIVM